MNPTFTKLMKLPAPVNGHVAIWQCGSRIFGRVGMND